MKKSNRLLIKTGLVFIFLCFLCIILCSNNVLALEKGETVETGAELWDETTKPKGKTVYCIEPGRRFYSGTYKVDTKWEIKGKTIKKNNKVININAINDKEKTKVENAIKRAYILAEKDENESTRLETAFTGTFKSGWDENGKRSIKQGIYDVLSYKQEALWKINGVNKWFWRNSTLLTYQWDLDGDGSLESTFGIQYSGGKYKFLRKTIS